MDIVGNNKLKKQLSMINDNAEAYRIGAVPVPNFVLNIRDGEGQTTVAEYIAYFLYKNRLRSFGGLDNLLEYRLDGSLKQLKKVFESIHSHAVYTNEFYGVISISIAQLYLCSNEYQVDYFLEEIVKVAEHATIIIFYDDRLGKKMEHVKDRVIEALGNCLDIVSHYTPADFAGIAAKNIIDRGIDLERGKEMDDLLCNTIETTNVTSVKQAVKLAEELVFYADYSNFIPRLDSKMIKNHISSIKQKGGMYEQ